MRPNRYKSKIRYAYPGLFTACVLLILSCRSAHTTGEKEETRSILSEIQAKGYLDIATQYSSTDYYIYKGVTRGFHYEMAQDFAEFLGVKLRIEEVHANLDTAIQRLQESKYDLLSVSMTQTTERAEKVIFSAPLFYTSEVLVRHKNNKSVTSLEDLGGKIIYVKPDAPYKHTLRQLRDSLRIAFEISEVSSFSSEDLLYLVESGEIDFTVTDENIARRFSSSMKNLDYSFKIKEGIPVSWALNARDQELAGKLDEWLQSVKRNGKLNIFYKRYFSNNHQISLSHSTYTLLKNGDISPFDKQLKKASRQLNWDWRLLAALVYTESRFNPHAISNVGAYGLMQVLPETAAMFGVKDYTSPDNNIYVGTQFLQHLHRVFSRFKMDKEEEIKFILASYNIGAGHVMDAMRLAEKYDKDPRKWEQNVDFYLLHKSDPVYYKDSLSRNGYCNGSQAYNYVLRVLDTYNNYKHIQP